MLYDKTFIQVLWVEDNVSIHDSFTLRAENFNIQLVPVECWEEAEPLLEMTTSVGKQSYLTQSVNTRRPTRMTLRNFFLMLLIA